MKRILLFIFLIPIICYLLIQHTPIIRYLVTESFHYFKEDFNDYSIKWKDITYEEAKKEIKNINNFYKKVYYSRRFRGFIPPLNFAVKYNKDPRVIKLLLDTEMDIPEYYEILIRSEKPLNVALDSKRNDDITKMIVDKDKEYSLFLLILTPQYEKYIDKYYQTTNEINILNYKKQNLLMYFLNNLQDNDYVKKNSHSIISYILSRDIDILHKDGEGKTALDYARENGNPEIIKLIEDAMEKEISKNK